MTYFPTLAAAKAAIETMPTPAPGMVWIARPCAGEYTLRLASIVEVDRALGVVTTDAKGRRLGRTSRRPAAYVAPCGSPDPYDA